MSELYDELNRALDEVAEILGITLPDTDCVYRLNEAEEAIKNQETFVKRYINEY